MSVRVMSLVWALELPDSQKIVLLALADSANDEGHCWPGMKSLTAKCSKSERTIQGVIKELVDAGHLTRREVPGKGCNYTVHPRNDCAPADTAPPQGLRQTPAAAAGKPSRTIKSNTQQARVISNDWKPEPFGAGSKCAEIIASWPDGELDTQIRHFTVHHRGKGNRFVDWQDAWETWVLNSRKWGGTKLGRPPDRAGQSNDYLAGMLAKAANA